MPQRISDADAAKLNEEARAFRAATGLSVVQTIPFSDRFTVIEWDETWDREGERHLDPVKVTDLDWPSREAAMAAFLPARAEAA